MSSCHCVFAWSDADAVFSFSRVIWPASLVIIQLAVKQRTDTAFVAGEWPSRVVSIVSSMVDAEL